ncbi:hypothetical protein JYU34_014059 [Plutella xylostella]|uniref:Peptidase S1 domain-containing protein n=1 Tax=Plutella xylostella TaxID=51655 RepID=A0ABQ7Q7I2_PLUXY|nr:hypothetical protein JYU34_014059 [Plutella xylostella]
MSIKYGFLLIALFSGCLAKPSLDDQDLSIFFDHVDTSAPSNRIMGGTPAEEGSAPYMAALVAGDNIRAYSCGGSIITPRTILTAAHCVENVWAYDQLMRLVSCGHS